MAGNEWRLPDEVSFKKRMLWWLGIYFGLQFPLILLFPFILNFPWGLAPYFAFLFGSTNEPAFRMAGYAFYLIHFVITAMAPGRKFFIFLMLVLIIVVSLNTVSCMKTTAPLWYKGIGKIEG